jgi:hypothetical protein
LEQQVLSLTEERNNLQNKLERKEEEFQREIIWKENEFRRELAGREMDRAGKQSNSAVEHALKGSKHKWAITLKSKGMPFLKKEINPASIIEMVSAANFAVLVVIMSRTRPIIRLKVVCMALFEYFVFGYHETKLVFHDIACKYVRQEVYVPWKILQAMDTAQTLRQVKSPQKWERGLLPGTTVIQEKATRMYEMGQRACPIKQITSPLGEMFSFEYERTLRLILKTFKLEEIAWTTSIEIFITLDGAELCEYLTHLTVGVKIVDKRAVDPQTGWPLCTFTEDLLGLAFTCQSCNFCFIMKSLIGKDTKDKTLMMSFPISSASLRCCRM